VLVAIGRGQPRAFKGDQKSRTVAFAFDVKSHHVRHFIVDAIVLVVFDARQGPAFAARA